MSSRSTRPTTTPRRGSRSGVTRSRPSSASIRSADRSSKTSTGCPIYPRTHYVTPRENLLRAIDGIRAELDHRLAELNRQEKLLEAQRLSQRTLFDLEMLTELGYCQGIENYSRHLTGRSPGEPPPTLLDYFPEDFLLIADESPRHHPAGRRDVPRRPVAQAEPGRLRLPSAVGPRQPAADVRGVRGAGPPGDLRLGDPGPVRARAQRGRDRRAGHPTHRAARPRSSRCGRRSTRSTISSPRSAPWSRAASGCW